MTQAEWEIVRAETWLNMEQAARRAGVCREAIRMAVRDGRLHALQCLDNGARGRSTLVPESEVARWASQRRRRGPRPAGDKQ